MDNFDNVELGAEPEEKKPNKAAKVVHMTAAVVIFILTALAFAFDAYFSIEMYILFHTAEGFEGLALLVIIPVVFLGMICTAVLGIIGIVLSSTAWRYRNGRDRIFGIISTILNSIFVVIGILLPIIVLLIGQPA